MCVPLSPAVRDAAPSPAPQIIKLRMVWADPQRVPCDYAVRVMASSTVQDVFNQLSPMVGVPANALMMFETFQLRIETVIFF